MLILLATCAILGFFAFIDLLERETGRVTPGDIYITLGVTAYLSAVTLIYQDNGPIAASLVTLLGWLINDVVSRVGALVKFRKWASPASLVILFIYIFVYLT